MIRAILKPEIYHGRGKRPPFFEGWYFKLVDRSEEHRFAVIPGVFLHSDPSAQHAFLQVLDGNFGRSQYHRFPFSEFIASADVFDIRVGPNRLSSNKITLDVDRDGHSVRGTLSFKNTTPWPVRLASPGVMGWYSWVPFMECYHGVLSFDHEIEGSLTVNGKEIDFTGGRGYIEKDWGKSFPLSHLWMQTNHFGRPGISLSASVAIIPWIRTSFAGFIVGLLLDGRLYRFATYTGAKITHLEILDRQISWTIRDKEHALTLRAHRSQGGLLHAPTVTEMTNRLLESLTSSVEVTLRKRTGGLVFSGTGRNAGLELGGSVEDLIALWKSERATKDRST
jgi:tocopherol cyclase